MKWVTRERPVIDRIACPWLIERFIDRQPEFLFVPPADVMRVAEETGATPYDVPGVELTHVGDGCSFDTFMSKYQLEGDPALVTIAKIVRGADTDRHDLTPQSAGLSRSRWDCVIFPPTTTRCWSTALSSMTRFTPGPRAARGRRIAGRQSSRRPEVMSEKLPISRSVNNYGGVVKRVNLIKEQLARAS